MAFEVKIPAGGESVVSGTIAQWHKNEGDLVEAGDLLLTVDTDKISSEVEAEVGGVLRIIVAEGEEVPVGSVVGRIVEGRAGSNESTDSPSPEEEPPTEPSPTEPIPSQSDDSDGKKSAKAERSPETESPSKAEKAPPEVEKTPSKTEKAPSKEVAPSKATSAPSEDDGRFTRKKMSPLRRKVATHLVNAQQTAAILTTFNECDMSAIMKLRKEIQESFLAKHGVKLGFMSFFIKAVVDGLKTVPQLNARIDGDDMIQNHYYDIGVAVGTDRGLLVPVLRDCDQKSCAELELGILDYAKRAREGKIEFSDLQGGVFTISNGGIYGSLLSTPILNPPQSGILGMHTIQERPVAVNGQVVIRPMMYLAVSYDHRLVDGKEAVTFLVRVKECLENPHRLLVEA